MPHRDKTLSEQIEQLVRDHIEATRREASEAVARAFSSMRATPRASAASKVSRTTGRRRGAAALSALGERLYEALRALPGETMAVLAPKLGCSPRELQRPMAGLKRTGRVRSVGQRHQTRYYPTVARSAS
jgi:CRP-like cAMP-binding protein